MITEVLKKSYYELYINDWNFLGTITRWHRPKKLVNLFEDSDKNSDLNNKYSEEDCSVYICNADEFVKRLEEKNINDKSISKILDKYSLDDIIQTFKLLIKNNLDGYDDIDKYLFDLNEYENEYKNNKFLNEYRSYDDEKQQELYKLDFRILLYVILTKIVKDDNSKIVLQLYK